MRALSPGVVALSKNSNGQHVIEHCLEHFSVQDNEVCSLLFRRFAIIRIFCSCCIWSWCFASSAHVIFMMSYILQESPFSNCFWSLKLWFEANPQLAKSWNISRLTLESRKHIIHAPEIYQLYHHVLLVRISCLCSRYKGKLLITQFESLICNWLLLVMFHSNKGCGTFVGNLLLTADGTRLKPGTLIKQPKF